MGFVFKKKWRKVEVESSQIKLIAHDSDVDKLYIQFKNNSVYEYSPVSLEDYIDFLNADSIGSHFYENFKTNKSLKTKKAHNG